MVSIAQRSLHQTHRRSICWQRHSWDCPSISLQFSCHRLSALTESHVHGPGWDGFTGKAAEKSFPWEGGRECWGYSASCQHHLQPDLSVLLSLTYLSRCVPSAASRCWMLKLNVTKSTLMLYLLLRTFASALRQNHNFFVMLLLWDEIICSPFSAENHCF